MLCWVRTEEKSEEKTYSFVACASSKKKDREVGGLYILYSIKLIIFIKNIYM